MTFSQLNVRTHHNNFFFYLQYDFKKKCQFDQHKRGFDHQTKEKAPSNIRKQQQLLREVTIPASRPQDQQFAKDVTMAFLQEGIPLHKLEKGPLRDILDKYCSDVKLPSVSTLRRLVPQLCEKVSYVQITVFDVIYVIDVIMFLCYLFYYVCK